VVTAFVAALLLVLGACSSTAEDELVDTTKVTDTTSTTTVALSTVGTQATTSTTAAMGDERFAEFSTCDAGGAPGVWLCSAFDVPIDRSDPTAGSISIKVWAHPHTDTTAPTADPVFMTPGGPGSSGLGNYGVFWLPQTVGDSRDIITIDPRGTGESGVIDCPELQDGFEYLFEWSSVAGDCGASLAGASDRYGAADRAMDVEAVRDWLGYDRIVYYGPSFGGVDAQAYAARYPDRVGALVLDASFRLSEQHDYWFVQAADQVTNVLRVADLMCAERTSCAEAAPDPTDTLTRMVGAIAATPLVGTATDGSDVVIDEPYLLEAAMEMDLVALVIAAAAYNSGNTQPLLDFAAANPSWYRSGGYGPDASDFSAGANLAGWCKEPLDPFDLNDTVDARLQKLDAALTALPEDAYAPWSKEAARFYSGFDQCVEWPVPDDGSEPALPASTSTSAFPVLALSGELDRWVPTETSRRLLEAYPDASFVIVADADHPTLSRGACVANLIAQFIQTLTPIEGKQCG
jgi:pimeloyl-ACP methyl ester carboxylesterase